MAHVIQAAPTTVVPVKGGGEFPVHRIYCVGRNYAEHAQEMGHSGREPPFFFTKPADTIVYVPEGETGRIEYPSLTQNFHHEIELVVAIGKGGRDIKASDAKAHIWGYGVGLDMTRRDLQNEAKKQGRPWCIGKAFDQASPIGPLRSIKDTGELGSGAITLKVNGQLKQKGDLSQLIWNVGEIIEHLSAGWALQPGDLIYTGTPGQTRRMTPGQVVEVTIEGLGTLRNPIA